MIATLNYSYTDFNGEIKELTIDELSWFYKVCEYMRKSVDRHISIVPDNHESLTGENKEALGLFYTTDKDNPYNDDCYISIDTWFIHEKYLETFEHISCIEPQSLEEVIAHELAHTDKFRHCKYHRKLVDKILEAYSKYYMTGEVTEFTRLTNTLK